MTTSTQTLSSSLSSSYEDHQNEKNPADLSDDNVPFSDISEVRAKYPDQTEITKKPSKKEKTELAFSTLDQMVAEAALLSEDQDSLTLGGHQTADSIQMSAIAQVDVATGLLLFAKTSQKADSIKAITRKSSDVSSLVALATTSVSEKKGYLLFVSEATGDLLQAPVQIALSGHANLRVSMIFDSQNNQDRLIVASASGYEGKHSRITVVHINSDQNNEIMKETRELANFQIAGGHDSTLLAHTVAKSQNDVLKQTIYLAGSSVEGDAAIAVLTLVGEENDLSMQIFRPENSEEEKGKSSIVTHLFKNDHDESLLGVSSSTKEHLQREQQTQVTAIWHLSHGDREDDTYTKTTSIFRLETREGAIVQPSLSQTGRTMHLLVQQPTQGQESLYLIVDIASGRMTHLTELPMHNTMPIQFMFSLTESTGLIVTQSKDRNLKIHLIGRNGQIDKLRSGSYSSYQHSEDQQENFEDGGSDDDQYSNREDTWSELLENLHVSFFAAAGDSSDTENLRSENFDEEFGKSSYENNSDTGDEGQQSSQSKMSQRSSSIGDVRMLQSDDSEDEESNDFSSDSEDEGDNFKDRKRRGSKNKGESSSANESRSKSSFERRDLCWWDDPDCWNDPDDFEPLTDDSQWVEDACSTLTFSGPGCENCWTRYPELDDQEYTITDNALVFSVSGIDPHRCQYRYSYTITSIDGEEAIVDFDKKTRTFTVQTDDPSILNGEESRNFHVTMYGTGWYLVESTFTLTLKDSPIDPCTDPSLVTIYAPQQTSPPPDKYSETDLVFTYNPFISVPDICAQRLFIGCKSVLGPIEYVSDTLECQELDANGQLTWNFNESDYLSQNVPPGDYTFTYDVGIPDLPEASWGSFTVVVTLVAPFDLCSDPSQVAIVETQQTSPPPDNYSETDVVFTYNPFGATLSICEPRLFVRCKSVEGPPNYFTNTLECQELDANGQLTWNFNEQDYLNENVPPGDYTFTYDVGIPNLPEAYWGSFTVVVSLIDPCNPASYVNCVWTLEDQMYTITDNTVSYVHPDVIFSPDFCLVDYTYDIPVLQNGGEPITRDGKQFDIYYKADLTPLDEGPMTVSMTANVYSFYAGSASGTSVTETFDVTFKNPCLDKDFVEIIPPVLIPYKFLIGSLAPLKFNHAPFTIITMPITHTLCGGSTFDSALTITPEFNNLVIDSNDEPVSYQEEDGTFSVFTESTQFLNQMVPYTLTASLVLFPQVEASTIPSTISFRDVCFDKDARQSIEATPQTNVEPDAFTGNPHIFSLTPFMVMPDVCQGLEYYECTDVQGPDDGDYSFLCNGFDGILNGDSTDGQLTLTATRDQFISGELVPGDFTFTITGTTPYAASRQRRLLQSTTATAEFVWTLTNPCSVSFDGTASPIVYTITDFEIIEMFPPIVVTPEYCNDFVVYSLDTEPSNYFINNAITFEGLDEIKIKEIGSLFVLGDQSPDNGYPQSNTYTLIYKATIGKGNTALVAEAETTITFRNPCYDPDFTDIVVVEAPQEIHYEIGLSQITVCCYEFEFVSMPIDHLLCGPLNFEVRFEGDAIDQDSLPLSRCSTDTCTTVFLYEDDLSLIDTSAEYSVAASFSFYPVREELEEFAGITYTDPCLAPAIFSLQTVIQLPLHSYTGDTSTNLHPFIISPNFCEIQYSCELTVGTANIPSCNVEGVVNFDEETLEFKFMAGFELYTVYPPGAYFFKVTGSTAVSNGESDQVTIILQLEDLCPTVTVELLPSPILDATYSLGEEGFRIELDFEIEDFYRITPVIQCGLTTIEFYDDLQKETLNLDLFYYNQEYFEILRLSPEELAGVYDISYTIIFNQYNELTTKWSDQFNEEPAFTMTLLAGDCSTNLELPERLELSCGPPSDQYSTYSGGIGWLRDVENLRVDNTSYVFFPFNDGVCEGPDNLASEDAVCTMSDFTQASFFFYSSNKLEVAGLQIQSEDVGYYLLGISVTYTSANTSERVTERKSFSVQVDHINTNGMLVMSFDDFEGVILDDPPVSREESDQITPYIVDVSPRGRIKLGFSDFLNWMNNDFFGEKQTTRKSNRKYKSAIKNNWQRKLTRQDLYLYNEENRGGFYEIFDMIELTLSSQTIDTIEPIKVEWTLEETSGSISEEFSSMIEIQMDIDNLTHSRDSYDTLVLSFNDANDLLQSVDGSKAISFGKQLSWSVSQLLVEEQTASDMEVLSTLSLTFILIVVSITFILAIFNGSLVGTWIFINSLQMMAHLPLISTGLSANARYFMRPLLDLTRLNLLPIVDEESASTGDWMRSGYHVGFVNNTLFILCIVSLLFTILLTVRILACFTKKRIPRLTGIIQSITIRFLLETCFELYLCSLISLTTLESQQGNYSNIISWMLGLVTLLAGMGGIIFVATLFCCKGPYLSDTYAKGSIQGSFWGKRTLHDDLQQIHFKEKEEGKNTDEEPQSAQEKKVSQQTVCHPEQTQTQSLITDSMGGMLTLKTTSPIKMQMQPLSSRELICIKQSPAKNNNDQKYSLEGGELIVNNDNGYLTTERDGGVMTEQGLITEVDNEEYQVTATPKGSLEGFIERKSQLKTIELGLKQEAQLRLKLEGLVKVRSGTSHLYLGLRLNTAHNSAIAQPLTFLITRFLFALVLALMQHVPQLATIALLALSLCLIAFTMTEKPWLDPNMSRLATFNDIFLYLVLCVNLESNAASNVAAADRGYISIGLFIGFILCNLTLITIKSANFIKLHCKRYRTLKARSKVGVVVVVKRQSSLAATAEKLVEAEEGADVAIRVDTDENNDDEVVTNSVIIRNRPGSIKSVKYQQMLFGMDNNMSEHQDVSVLNMNDFIEIQDDDINHFLKAREEVVGDPLPQVEQSAAGNNGQLMQKVRSLAGVCRALIQEAEHHGEDSSSIRDFADNSSAEHAAYGDYSQDDEIGFQQPNDEEVDHPEVLSKQDVDRIMSFRQEMHRRLNTPEWAATIPGGVEYLGNTRNHQNNVDLENKSTALCCGDDKKRKV